MPDQRPDDHNTPGAIPRDPAVTASCPACGWHTDMCHCPSES